jgi:SAM-dependent methyltransferase
VDDVRTGVRDHYAKIAESAGASGRECGCSSGKGFYEPADLAAIPVGADMGLGCGNPTAIAELHRGETVVDLGSGGGVDCFLAASRVGPEGRVIGVDMTPQMIDRARAAAKKGSWRNVEFRLGEIESLPVADGTADAVLSNCVINLSPDKPRVFREAWRVLKPGGRLQVTDIVLKEPLPEEARRSIELWAGCISGALLEEDYLAAVRAAGFGKVEIRAERPAVGALDDEEKSRLGAGIPAASPQEVERLARTVVSVELYAVK